MSQMLRSSFDWCSQKRTTQISTNYIIIFLSIYQHMHAVLYYFGAIFGVYFYYGLIILILRLFRSFTR